MGRQYYYTTEYYFNPSKKYVEPMRSFYFRVHANAVNSVLLWMCIRELMCGVRELNDV